MRVFSFGAQRSGGSDISAQSRAQGRVVVPRGFVQSLMNPAGNECTGVVCPPGQACSGGMCVVPSGWSVPAPAAAVSPPDQQAANNATRNVVVQAGSPGVDVSGGDPQTDDSQPVAHSQDDVGVQAPPPPNVWGGLAIAFVIGKALAFF